MLQLPEIAAPVGKAPEPQGETPEPLGETLEPQGETLEPAPEGLGHATVTRAEVEVPTEGTPIIKDGAKDFVETKVKWNSTSRPIFKTLWYLASTFVAALRVRST